MAVQHRPDFYSLLIWVCVFIVRHENKLPFIHDTKNKGFNCHFFSPFNSFSLPVRLSLYMHFLSITSSSLALPLFAVLKLSDLTCLSLSHRALCLTQPHTHTHTETRLSLSPALTQARCLISSSVVWKCVCVCVCLYKDKLAQGLLRKCQDCHWERCEMALNRHSLAVTNTEQATCRSVVWEYIVSLP